MRKVLAEIDLLRRVADEPQGRQVYGAGALRVAAGLPALRAINLVGCVHWQIVIGATEPVLIIIAAALLLLIVLTGRTGCSCPGGGYFTTLFAPAQTAFSSAGQNQSFVTRFLLRAEEGE